MLASHLLWSFWSVIQSSGVSHSSASHPSWLPQADGTTFSPPALGYLEYAEQRMELYTRLKHAWMKHADVRGTVDDDFAQPLPSWQSLRNADEWREYTERLAPVHEELNRIRLTSSQRQDEAYQRYEAAAAAANTRAQ